jgi:hypothetical protein
MITELFRENEVGIEGSEGADGLKGKDTILQMDSNPNNIQTNIHSAFYVYICIRYISDGNY